MISVSRRRIGVALGLATGLLVMPLAALAVDRPDLQIVLDSVTSPYLTAPPTHVLPGDTITIAAVVKNFGPVATQVPAQSDIATKFFLVPTSGGPKKNLKGIQIVKPGDPNPNLGPGESYGSTEAYALFSDTAAGTYKLQACADGFSFIAESDEGNNCFTTTGTIIVDQAPDLIVSAIKTPSLSGGSVGLGGSFQVENTVKNIGPVASAKSITKYFLVQPPPSNVSKDLKGPLDHPSDPPGGPSVPAEVPALDAAGDPLDSFDEIEMVTVRPETIPGTYFLKACADGGKFLPEQDNDNNCLTSSGSFEVKAMPDLVVSSLTVTPSLPASVSPGDPIVVIADVTNQGGASTLKQSTLKAVLVKANTVPEVQKNLKLASALTVPTLAAGASVTINSGTKITIYSDTLPGTYFVRFCADLGKVIPEAVESNNCTDSNDADTTKTLTVLGPTSNADLQVSAVTDVQCSPPACADVVPGNNVSAKVTVVNSGTEAVDASATNPLTISFKLIQGIKEKNLKVLDASSMLITQPILPGASVGPLPITVQVYSDTLAGDYGVQVCVDDPKKFAETNNNNNCNTQPPVCSTTEIDPLVTATPPTRNTGNDCPGAPLACTFGTGGTCTGQFHQITPAPIVTVHGVSSAGANLTVTSISNPPSNAQLGDSFSVTITAKNIGVAAATVASHSKYLLVTTDTPPVIVADLSSPTTNTVPALPADTAISDKETVTIRTNTPLGEYKVQVCLDSNKAVGETNEDDNCRTSSGKIVVNGLPDYVVSEVTVTNAVPQVKRGARINLTTKVKNQGIGDATKDSILKFDLVSTTAGGPTSGLTGTRTIANLNAGASTALLTASVIVANNAPLGTFRVRACADATDVLLESATGPLGTSEQNNCTLTSTTVEVIAQ